MTSGFRLLPKDAPRPIPPRTFAWIMFGLAAGTALLGVRVIPLTWGTEHLPPTLFFIASGLVLTISLGVWVLRIAPKYVEPIRDDFRTTSEVLRREWIDRSFRYDDVEPRSVAPER